MGNPLRGQGIGIFYLLDLFEIRTDFPEFLLTITCYRYVMLIPENQIHKNLLRIVAGQWFIYRVCLRRVRIWVFQNS